MKKYLMTTSFVVALTLAGCATPGSPPGVNVNFVEEVRKAAVAVCGFLPYADTVAAIIATGNPIVLTVSSLANAICAAVTAIPPAQVRRGASPPTVAGVIIHGKFVR
jgi:hypothetical protein